LYKLNTEKNRFEISITKFERASFADVVRMYVLSCHVLCQRLWNTGQIGHQDVYGLS